MRPTRKLAFLLLIVLSLHDISLPLCVSKLNAIPVCPTTYDWLFAIYVCLEPSDWLVPSAVPLRWRCNSGSEKNLSTHLMVKYKNIAMLIPDKYLFLSRILIILSFCLSLHTLNILSKHLQNNCK